MCLLTYRIDGVPGLTQTGIPPGESFVYKWTATQYGTYWYHGHYRGQLEDGLYGAINIKYVLNNSHASPMGLYPKLTSIDRREEHLTPWARYQTPAKICIN